MRNTILEREEGQDLAEYALLIALIALIVIGAVTLLGGKLNTIFDAIQGQLNVPAG
jgi:pilus assembly protein Flp/PilA